MRLVTLYFMSLSLSLSVFFLFLISFFLFLALPSFSFPFSLFFSFLPSFLPMKTRDLHFKLFKYVSFLQN